MFVQFHGTSLIPSVLIEWFSWSFHFEGWKFKPGISHTAWYDPFDNYDEHTEGCLWESWPRVGVNRFPSIATNHTKGTLVDFWRVYYIDENGQRKEYGRTQYRAVSEEWRAIQGCGYDWKGVFSFPLRFKLDEPNEFFCSEAAHRCVRRGVQALLRKPDWKIMPCESTLNHQMCEYSHSKRVGE